MAKYKIAIINRVTVNVSKWYIQRSIGRSCIYNYYTCDISQFQMSAKFINSSSVLT